MDVWNLSERRAAILAILQELCRHERVPATVLARIEQLYTEGHDFAAERLAGLAIWYGAGSAETLATLFEHLGILLRELRVLATAVEKAEVLQAWTLVAASPSEFFRHCGLSSSAFADRLRYVLGRLPPEAPTTLVERGREMRRIVGLLAGQRDVVPGSTGTSGGTIEPAAVILHTIDAAATRVANEFLALGRQLWQVRLWQEWQKVAPSYPAFLEDWLGLGTALGSRLSAVWQTFADLDARRPPLRRLELLITLAARSASEPQRAPRKEVAHGAHA